MQTLAAIAFDPAIRGVLVVATGVSYKALSAPGLAELAGAGVYYGAATTEALAAEGVARLILGRFGRLRGFFFRLLRQRGRRSECQHHGQQGAHDDRSTVEKSR